MLVYVNGYLGCCALFLELIARAPLWPEEQAEPLVSHQPISRRVPHPINANQARVTSPPDPRTSAAV